MKVSNYERREEIEKVRKKRLKKHIDGNKKARSLSQEEFARRIGITRRTYQHFLNSDEPTLSSDKLSLMADELNVSTDFLLGRTKELNLNDDEFSQQTGLSVNAIEALRVLNGREYKGMERFFATLSWLIVLEEEEEHQSILFDLCNLMTTPKDSVLYSIPDGNPDSAIPKGVVDGSLWIADERASQKITSDIVKQGLENDLLRLIDSRRSKFYQEVQSKWTRRSRKEEDDLK